MQMKIPCKAKQTALQTYQMPYKTNQMSYKTNQNVLNPKLRCLTKKKMS